MSREVEELQRATRERPLDCSLPLNISWGTRIPDLDATDTGPSPSSSRSGGGSDGAASVGIPGVRDIKGVRIEQPYAQAASFVVAAPNSFCESYDCCSSEDAAALAIAGGAVGKQHAAALVEAFYTLCEVSGMRCLAHCFKGDLRWWTDLTSGNLHSACLLSHLISNSGGTIEPLPSSDAAPAPAADANDGDDVATPRTPAAATPLPFRSDSTSGARQDRQFSESFEFFNGIQLPDLQCTPPPCSPLRM